MHVVHDPRTDRPPRVEVTPPTSTTSRSRENPDRKRRNLRLPQGLLRFFLVAEHARGPRLLRRAAQEQLSLFRRRRASFERDAWRRLRRARGLRGQAREQGRFQIAIAFAPPRIAAKLHAVMPPASRYAELSGRWIFHRCPLDQIDKPPPKYTPIRRGKSPNQPEPSYA